MLEASVCSSLHSRVNGKYLAEEDEKQRTCYYTPWFHSFLPTTLCRPCYLSLVVGMAREAWIGTLALHLHAQGRFTAPGCFLNKIRLSICHPWEPIPSFCQMDKTFLMVLDSFLFEWPLKALFLLHCHLPPGTSLLSVWPVWLSPLFSFWLGSTQVLVEQG